MSEPKCDGCRLRAKYDADHKSLVGRFWHWHIRFCPGWKAYLASLDEAARKEMTERYGCGKR